MERLTKYDKDGTAIASEFADENYIMQDDHDKFTGYINSPIVDRLAELEDKLESGQLVELPCKVGDIVYRKWSGGKNKTSLAEFYVTHIEITRAGICFYCLAKNNACIERKFFMKDYGEVWFATKAQAEARRKELQEKL